jgi:hypothetical protein
MYINKNVALKATRFYFVAFLQQFITEETQ